jgi:deoxyribonuclease V
MAGLVCLTAGGGPPDQNGQPMLHPWHLTPADAETLQTQLAGRVSLAPLGPVATVAGCDIAYDTDSPLLSAAVVVVRLPGLEEVERAVVREEAKFPYVPGLLSFRECPALLSAFDRLRTRPDVLMLDGQGIAHPRRFGLACHLGLWLDLPAVGCAKTWLFGDHGEVGPTAGDHTPLNHAGDTIGAVVRTASGVRPCFVSPGHRCDVASAVGLVRAVLSGYRHPVPTRLAHMAANEARAAGKAGGGVAPPT